MAFVDRVVAGHVLFPGLASFDHFATDELGDDAVDAIVLVGRLLGGTADDERCASFVNQDGVYLVDYGVVVTALDAIIQAELHVVAKVVETELVVGAVS